MSLRLLQFAAALLTALALVPGGAHLLELWSKMALDQNDYMVVQRIYRGWAATGIVLVSAVAANTLLAVLSRRQGIPATCAAVATGLLCATLAIFFAWTFPANQVTDNWTVAPGNWSALRTVWEYSHAVNAVLTFLALCAVLASGLSWSEPPR